MMSDPPVIRSIDYGDRGQVQVFADAEALAVAAASTAIAIGSRAVEERSAYYLALSGGTTPWRMGEVLAGPDTAELDIWCSTYVFWGDERWVPFDDPDSNAGVAVNGFLEEMAIPVEQIHPMPTDREHPETAARDYARLVAETVPAEGTLPRFDLVFLGMGNDGHTASLFPFTEALSEQSELVVANPVPKLETTRLTMTVPLLNAARTIVFLVAGERKADVLARVLEGPNNTDELPSQLIRPEDGRLLWMIDQAAAADLLAW